jgi:NADPH:quinone reductase-like Zn-dependent oxidoreductase
MRAIRVDHFGGPEVLALVEAELPEAAPGEVLVRVAAAGVNPVDWAVRSGAAGDRFGSPPYIPGWDIAGVIEAAGPGTGSFAPGDRVYGMPRFPAMASAYAEHVTAPAAHLAAAPAHLSDTDAAGLPLAGLTALQVLDQAGVVSGQRVLVHAAAGGVGHLAVQLAKARGAYVLGTARAGKHEFLRDLGVDEPIDYSAVAFEDAAKDVDLVIDTIGGEYGDRSLGMIRPGGMLIVIHGGISAELAAAAAAAGIRAETHMVVPDGPGLARLAEFVQSGQLTVVIDQLFPLARAADAHRRGETGRAQGKIVLSVAG